MILVTGATGFVGRTSSLKRMPKEIEVAYGDINDKAGGS